MQVLHQTETTPPKGWTYEVEGKVISAVSFQYLVNNVRSHYHSIDKIPPKNLELVIMDSICQGLPIGEQETRCRYTEPPTWSQLLSKAAYALSKWTSKGFQLVTEDQLLERRNTCTECSFWNGESAFGIGRCGSCGCTGVKLHVATEKCPHDKWEATV